MRLPTSKFVFGICTSAFICVGALLSEAQAGLELYGSGFSRDPFDNNLSNLYSINPSTGAATLIGNTGFRLVGGIDFDSSGVMYGVGEQYIPGGPPFNGPLQLITISKYTGIGTVVGNLGVTKTFQDISFRNSDGQLFAYASGELYTINKTSGAASFVGLTGEVEIGGGLEFTSGDTLLKTGFDHAFSLNQSNGSGTNLVQLGYPAFPPGDTPNVTGMDYDHQFTGSLFAVVHNDATDFSTTYLATIDIGTGVITKIGDSVIGLTAITAIPEPSTFGVVAGVALMGIGTLGRNRRKKAVSI